ncbi:MAG TPA: DEAD/DEAH box helicase [Solirubrobacteraceae bacterium]|jgi:ATP-dependent Lhr-like helicase|nr:DEAD/DEAH box helicase [Solirubrobacteraceae bacterium]
MSLSLFTPRVLKWFEAAFAQPTPAQAQAWPAIARGEHVLVAAPTGSGKTLAAFLCALDRLLAEPAAKQECRVRVVYVSPLKALSYDIERNLRAPLKGIGADVRVAIRTGDTPQRERQAMLKKPPDILITTPESLHLMLTSRAREILRGAELVIVDEIHAVAATKRGAHLALTLERLDALVRDAAGREPQRIGLSATQTPLAEVARFLVGPERKCTIVDAGVRKPLDVKVQVPVESMTELHDKGEGPGSPASGRLRHPPGHIHGDSDQPLHGSIWPAIYPELLRLIRAHNSTIVFVNNRRSAERLALRLNELAAREQEGEEEGRGGAAASTGQVAHREIARAHHGSLAREERLVVEELLKAGEIPCIVATSSLELGIDMGAVDLVLQVESPKSVAAGLQRIGRAGHGVGEVSRGRIFPKFRADLLECAVLAQRMREGAIEPTVVPRNPLDVLAQQVVAMAAAEEELAVEELQRRLARTHSYAELPRRQLEGVLDMLGGRYPSAEFGELRPRIVWDRVAGAIRPRKGARALAVANAGTIPDRGLYLVTLPDGRRVGELDEEMVYEARPGQVFLLGASAWRIQEIGRDRVIVTPAPGAPGAVPFWKGEGVGRPKELGAAIGAFARWAVEESPETLARDYDLDPRAARNLLEYLREQLHATGVLPSDRTVVVERFRDEIGDWRLCVLSPYGGRIHAAWGLALSARIRARLGLEADAIFSDDGIIVHLPDGDELDTAQALELVLVEPEELEDLVVGELGGSALFGARFREAAGRALLIPRAYPGKRTPLWQQRLKAQTLLEVARRYEDFPIVLEAYRECLRDVLDLPGLRELLGMLHRRELSVVGVETATASPFASSLLFDYVATYMYEGDAPNAERRAAALSLDRDLLRELLGQEELRELIDPGALQRLESQLQRRDELRRAATRDELHDTLRLLGDLGPAEVAARVLDGVDATGLLAGLERERRAVHMRVGGEQRHIDAADAGLYRDALGVVPPGGLPAAFLADVPDALERLLRRYAATRGPFTSEQPARRYGLGVAVVESALRALERSGALVRGELHPDPAALRAAAPPVAGGVAGGVRGDVAGGVRGDVAGGVSEEAAGVAGGIGGVLGPAVRDDGREWCDVEVLRRLRRASLAALRSEIEPAEQRTFATFLPAWQGVDRHGAAGAGVERLREALVPLQGLALTPRTWERDVLPRRIGAYSTTWMDELCASGELVWVGVGAGRAGSRPPRADGRVALCFREDVGLLGPPAPRGQPPAQAREDQDREDLNPDHLDRDYLQRARVRARLYEGACFFTDLLGDVECPASELHEALWTLVWAGEVTNDAFAVLRLPRPAVGSTRDGSPTAWPAGRRRVARRARRSAHPPGRWSLTAPLLGKEESPAERRRALAELLLERHGILTRESVRAEGVPGGFAALYPELCRLETLGVVRRGYFVEGLGGAQFALPGAVERLRAQRERDEPLVLAANDPAQPYGAALPWPDHGLPVGRRQSGASVVMVDAQPVLQLERGGRRLRVLAPAEREVGASACAARRLERGSDQSRAVADRPGPTAYLPGLSAAGPDDPRVQRALTALAEHARAGRLGERIALERVDGEPVLGSRWEAALERAGFRIGPRRVELAG